MCCARATSFALRLELESFVLKEHAATALLAKGGARVVTEQHVLRIQRRMRDYGTGRALPAVAPRARSTADLECETYGAAVFSCGAETACATPSSAQAARNIPQACLAPVAGHVDGRYVWRRPTELRSQALPQVHG